MMKWLDQLTLLAINQTALDAEVRRRIVGSNEQVVPGHFEN
jgi:hypothetical protein